MAKITKNRNFPLEKEYNLFSSYLNHCNEDQLVELLNLTLVKYIKLKNEKYPESLNYSIYCSMREEDEMFNIYEEIE